MSNNTPKTGEFCWNELITQDTAAAKEFYGSLFGWEIHDIDMGDVTYTMFKSGDKEIGGMLQTPQGQNIPPHWMSYINVEDLDAATEKATSLGATVMVPAKNVGDFGRFSVIVDPTGAHIALWQMLKSC